MRQSRNATDLGGHSVLRDRPPRRDHSLRDTSSRELSLGARIAALEGELAELRRRQRAELALDIATAVEKHIRKEKYFTAKELFDVRSLHPDLDEALRKRGVTDARRLGKLLWRLRGRSGGVWIERHKDEHGRALWWCGVVADSTLDPCASRETGL